VNNDVEAPEVVGFSAARLARIRPVMQKFVDQHGFAGISTLIARRGRVVYADQVGVQDKDSQTPLAADTIFRIYSMTKPIICVALMTLFEEGRFHLFDPVAKFLPAFGKLRVLSATPSGELTETELVRPVTLRDLFTHTAGLTYNFLEDSPVGELYRQANLMSDTRRSLEATIGELTRLPLAYQPGTRWHYSMAIDVLAHLIEVIAGQPLRDVLRQRLFEPLGMHDTDFFVPPDKRHRVATVYGHPDITTTTFGAIFAAWQQGYNERIDVAATYPADNTSNFVRGGHGLFSTTTDYLRFAQMLLNRGQLDGARILAPKVVDLMHMNHIPPALLPFEVGGIYSNGYGHGLDGRVLLNPAEAMIPGSVGEFGWSGAAKTYYWVDPHEQLIGILMSQFMVSFEHPEKALQVLAYQALIE
jgi:CubicO group peptidase (beta-lactamase class C family)